MFHVEQYKSWAKKLQHKSKRFIMNKRIKPKEKIMENQDRIQDIFNRLQDIETQIEIIENGVTTGNENLVSIKATVESNNVLLKQISEKVTDYHLEDMKINESIKSTVGATDGKLKGIADNITAILATLKRLFPWIPKPRELKNGKGIEVTE